MGYNENVMYVVYSSDDNYARHRGASVCSLLCSNKKFVKIKIFLIENGISEFNRQNIKQVVSGFKNAEIEFIDFLGWKDKLKLDMAWNISLSAYARLFLGEMLPEYVDRVLYLDCDTIVCGSLTALWNCDMRGAVVAAVQDDVSKDVKTAVGLNPQDKYFNSGVLLIDLYKWRQCGADKLCLNFIDERKGRVIHHDQGVLNGVLKDSKLILPLKYNVMTIHYIFSRDRILSYYNEAAAFYSESEINSAKENPMILHFTPSFTTRPWVKNCRHPLRERYWHYLSKTPWKDAKPEKCTDKWYVRLIDWKNRNF